MIERHADPQRLVLGTRIAHDHSPFKTECKLSQDIVSSQHNTLIFVGWIYPAQNARQVISDDVLAPKHRL